jgi:S-DNA-T family DNA segregation ATPase FtsK/SpoIIIE
VLLPPPRLDDLPVVATLTRGGLGIVGPPELSAGSARWILCQLLIMHSPAEVSIRIVAGAHARWHWLRWIPHLRSTGTGGAGRPLFDELSDELRRRRQAQASPATVAANPWIVVVVDGLDDPTTLARWSELLCDAHPVRMVGVFVCAHKELLPAAVRMIAACDGSRPSLISLEADGVQTLPGVRADRVGTAYAESLSRGIACLRDAGSRAGGDMPSEVDLFDLYGIRTLCVSSVLDRWSAYAGGATAILGACGSGPLPIDLVRNGPHLLLAGTTGSGKSELLRAFIAGLAISSPPNRLGFVLIDYKGGSAFGDCIGLPHTTALVTDLDRPETERALRSLRAEIRRRERMLAQAGARDIDDYHQTHAAIDSSLARLVIVIDEFAALAVDLPEFIDGLVDIAQRGRSLGIHLVLATQRPNGVVSPQIKSNTDIKIALRVAESAESVDVLGAPHAASISKSTPGRGYALVNSERRYFQAARLGDPPRDDGVRVVVLEDWTTSPTSSNTGRPHQSAANRLDRLSGTTVQSGMSVLCQVMDAAATARDVARPSAPWRPPLPHLLSCGELPVATDETGADAETFDGHGAVHFTESLIAYGLVDVPDEQSQYPIGCDLGDGGVLSFIGSPRSGRSAALRTLLGQAASRLTPDELHCYLIDAVGDITGQVGDLPHVGAAIDLRQPAAVRRLIHLLGRDIDCRRSQLAAGGFASLGRARQAGLMLPYVLLLIDGWDELTAMSERTDSGRSVDCLLGLLRDAAAAGYTVVVTGGRSMLSARVAANVARTHLLNLLNPQDYLVAGLRSRDVPANPPPGRAVIVQSGRHMQVGLLNDDPQPHAQWEAFRRMTANADLSVVPRTMIRLEPLPGPTGLHQVKSRHRIERDTGALIALGGDVPRLLRFDPALDQRFLVIGEPRSGRTNLLLSIAVQSVGRRPVLVVSPLESLLTAWARESGIAVVTGSSAGPDPAALLNDASPGTIVLVDDADQLDDHLDAGAGELCGRRPDLVFVASTRPQPVRMRFTGFVNELRQRRAGILLSPIATDCDLLGVRYPVEGLDCDVPGRGLLTSTEIRSLGFEALGVQTLLATEGDDVQTVSRPMSTSTMEIS